ncbi:MAG: sigma-70 family RNA polymerase sigma factor [Bacteroidales bacterium]
MLNDNEIIEGCLKNDRKMQKALYDKYASVMYAICLRYAKREEEAMDILQEGFIKVYRHIDQFSGLHSFEGWMKRIFINTSITYYKQNLKFYYQQDITNINEPDENTFNAYEQEFTREELLSIIQELSDGYKLVFNMYAIEGYKHKEIAEMLGIDIATSKSQYHRAKKIIQSKLIELSKTKLEHEKL